MIDQIKKYIRLAEHVALVVALLIAGIWYHRYNVAKQAKEDADIAAKGLAADTLARYTLHDRELLQQVRDAQGKTVVKTIYVPAEGGVTEVVKKPVVVGGKIIEPEKITLVVKTWGLTSRFGWGLVVSPSVKTSITYDGGTISLPVVPSLDWKFAYAGRYSAILELNPLFVGPGLTRHLDDVTPKFLHMDNIELGVTGGWGWAGSRYLGLYLRNNF